MAVHCETFNRIIILVFIILCPTSSLFESSNNELRLLAGIMEKLRYKMRVKKARRKMPYRILSPGPYTTEMVDRFRFHTGSTFTGPYGPLGGDGLGEFRFHNGVVYHGLVVNNMFSGEGTLTFPNGGKFKAFWIQGIAFNPKYTFSDGLQYEHKGWKYCKIPDRRFFSEYHHGFKPSGNVQLANDHPARAIPVGYYDSGEGFYNPHTKELIHPITGEFIRLPSEMERQWILEHCRREWITPLPFDPEIYENWFPKFNEKKLSDTQSSVWEEIHARVGERTGLEKKIESIIDFKPNVLNTSEGQIIRMNNIFNKVYNSKWTAAEL